MSKYSARYFAVSVLIIFYLVSCGEKFSMDYVPKPEEIKENLSEFILDDAQIEGLEANMDVDSTVFRYTPKVSAQTSTENILTGITEKAQKEGWKLVEKSAILRFNRFEPSGKFFSAEEARIVIIHKNSKVYVAHVRTFTGTPVLRFEDAGSGARFAKKVIWPMLESYINQEEGFVNEIKDKYLNGKKKDRNLPALRELAKTKIEEIVRGVEAALGENEVLSKKAAIYLCHRSSGRTLREIGGHFGIGESAVSQISRRFIALLDKDKKLNKKIKYICDGLKVV